MEVEIGVGCTIIGLVIGFFTFSRNRDKDVKSDATENAVIWTKLDNIGSSVESIRVDMKVSERKQEEITERVIRVEESAKQAHKRLDGIEERGITQ